MGKIRKRIVSRVTLKKCKEIDRVCQGCDQTPIDPHHIIPKSYRGILEASGVLIHGGDDTLENTIGLCLSCHRKMHDGYYKDGKYISPLKAMVYLLRKLKPRKIFRWKVVLEILERKLNENNIQHK